MRIVAGQYKGRPIQAPKTQTTRPTSDRARESLFNMIAHAAWAPALEGARVIDLFAGSGALGLEALSRGAGYCLFVETASAARGAIRNNIEALNLFGMTRIHRRSATELGSLPTGSAEQFDIAFLDPPYHQDLVEPCLASLKAGNWLSNNALVVVETAVEERFDFADWTLVKEKVIGNSRIYVIVSNDEGLINR